MNKKSQAALEFLTTYAWAFIIILILIGAFVYFGILKPSKFFPDRCNFGAEIGCEYHTIGSNGLQLKLKNNAGEPITVDTLSISTEKEELTCNSDIFGAWAAGEVKDVSIVCDFADTEIIQGDKTKVNLKLVYHPSMASASFSKVVEGEVFAVAEPKNISYDYLEAGADSGIGEFADLVAAYNFNEDDGFILTDISGNGNDGTLEGSGELVKNGGAETGTNENFNFDGVTSTDKNSGTYSFYEEGGKTIRSSEYIPIDLDKSYSLEGWFKSYGTDLSRLYFGYVPYDENKIQIRHPEIHINPNTETTLYEGCDATDKIVKIVNGTNWVTWTYAYMAFEIDDSGNYNDLPNRKLSNRDIIRVENKGSYWEVEFNTNVGRAYPAGTKVREHRDGGTYMYEAAGGAYIPTTWTKYSSTTSGENLYGASGGKWWRGTKFAQILMLANYAQSSDYKLRVDDISLHSTPPTYTGPQWVEGKYGSALSFDGVDDYVKLGNVGAFKVATKTVEFWAYPKSAIASTKPLVSSGTSNWYVGFASINRMIVSYNNGAAQKTVYGTNNQVVLNEWQHYAYTFEVSGSNVNIKFYIDGVNVKNQTNTDGYSLSYGAAWVIGAFTSTANFFNGLIDSVAIYDRTLTENEIKLHASS